MVEAQRYPLDFNGILAGAPAAFEAQLNGEFQTWLIRANTDSSGHEILPSEKLPALHAAVVSACGDGKGYVSDPRSCDFNPATMQCPPHRDNNSCLTPEQVQVVISLYRGPSDRQGQSLYPGGEPYGSELAWSRWMVDRSSDRAWPDDTAAEQFASNYLRYMAYPEDPPASYSIAEFRFDLSSYQRLGTLSSVYDAIDPNLSAFSNAGGKLILYQGWADEAVPPFGTVAYYAAVVNAAGGFDQSQDFSRLYMIPGQYHCLAGGDPAVAGSDLLSPLMSWVETGASPGVVSMPLAKPTTNLRVLTVSPLDPVAPPIGDSLGLNSHYNWVGSLAASSSG